MAIELKALLRDMKREMQDGVFVFCTAAGHPGHSRPNKSAAHIREQEGTTLVLRREDAETFSATAQPKSKVQHDYEELRHRQSRTTEIDERAGVRKGPCQRSIATQHDGANLGL